VARTTQGRREAAPLRQGRFGRGSTRQGQNEPVRRFGRASARPSGGALRRRRGQPEQSGAQKLIQVVRGLLPGGGGKSSTKSGKKGRGGRRGGKPAMFGLLGAGAAGTAAAVAKRRYRARSSQPAGETRNLPDAQATSTPATTPAHRPDTPEPGDQRG